jgi:hypothetical protein
MQEHIIEAGLLTGGEKSCRRLDRIDPGHHLERVDRLLHDGLQESRWEEERFRMGERYRRKKNILEHNQWHMDNIF